MDSTVKRKKEKLVIEEMISLYCRKQHHGQGLCKECEELRSYAHQRIDSCPFMESKTFCSSCRVHCYQKEQREQIRSVMRFSGWRMLLHRPLMVIQHIWLSRKETYMKPIYFIIGVLSMILGAAGVVLPVLPTTPFLLLSAWCFAKSSRRFHCWFISTQLYKNHLDSFVQHRSMTRKTKVSLLTFASLMLLAAMYFMNNLWLRLFLFALMLFKYYYFLFRIKTIHQ